MPRPPLGPGHPGLSTPPTGVIGRGHAADGPHAPGSIPYFNFFRSGGTRDQGPRPPLARAPLAGRLSEG